LNKKVNKKPLFSGFCFCSKFNWFKFGCRTRKWRKIFWGVFQIRRNKFFWNWRS